MHIEILSNNEIIGNFPLDDFRVDVTREQAMWELGRRDPIMVPRREETDIILLTRSRIAVNFVEYIYNTNTFGGFDLKIYLENEILTFLDCFAQLMDLNDFGGEFMYSFTFKRYGSNEYTYEKQREICETHDWMTEGF